MKSKEALCQQTLLMTSFIYIPKNVYITKATINRQLGLSLAENLKELILSKDNIGFKIFNNILLHLNIRTKPHNLIH